MCTYYPSLPYCENCLFTIPVKVDTVIPVTTRLSIDGKFMLIMVDLVYLKSNILTLAYFRVYKIMLFNQNDF